MKSGNPDGRVRALLVMARSRRPAWEAGLKLLDVAITAVSRNSRAQEILVAGEPPDLILTDEILTDADWRQTVEEALRHDPNSLVVVCARSAPDSYFWSEVLHRGAYDVLADANNHTALASLVRTATLRRGRSGTIEDSSGLATIDRGFSVEAALGPKGPVHDTTTCHPGCIAG